MNGNYYKFKQEAPDPNQRRQDQFVGMPLVAGAGLYQDPIQYPEFYQDGNYEQQYFYGYPYSYYGVGYDGNPLYFSYPQSWEAVQPPVHPQEPPQTRPTTQSYQTKQRRSQANLNLNTARLENTAQPEIQQQGAQPQNEAESAGKKKKKKRNRKKASLNAPKDTVCEPKSGETPNLPTLVKQPEKQKTQKKVQFLVPEKVEKEPAVSETPEQQKPSITKPLDYSKLFTNKIEKQQLTEQWPALPGQSKRKPEEKSRTFDDRTERPFLDWRDTRTRGPEPRKQESTQTKPESHQEARDLETKEPADEGWVRVETKKKTVTKPEPKPKTAPAVAVSETEGKAEASEAAKLKKEKRKQKEKDKKRRIREQKLLEEKLAPKGRKVTVLTAQMLQKLQGSSKSVKNPTRPVTLALEEYPPLLAAPRRTSESDSEWETTEVEVTVAAKPETVSKVSEAESKAAGKNIKRKDPIQLDLFSLIKVNKPKKEKPVHGSKIVRKHLATTNILDSSAPNQYRGKIRNRKKKATPLRKAIVQARQERKTRNSELAAPNVPSQSDAEKKPSPKLHTRKFREYCDQMLTDEIDALAKEILYNLRRFQDRAYQKDPIKARMRKRLVAGLREVTKQVDRNRIKLIFLAPDIERCPTTGGLDEAVNKLLDVAKARNVPCVYGLSRRKLGRILNKHVPVSCCATFNYQGTEEIHKKLMEVVERARSEYADKVKQFSPPAHSTKDQKDADVPETGQRARQTDFTKSPVDEAQDHMIEILKSGLKLDN